jgi:hypothetical protein
MLLRDVRSVRLWKIRQEYGKTRDVRPYQAVVLRNLDPPMVMLDVESFGWLLSEAVKADPAGWARPKVAKRNSDDGRK